MKIVNSFNNFLTRTKNSCGYWQQYLFFLALRFVLVFLPQIGYIHPDEFFQIPEIIIGKLFGFIILAPAYRVLKFIEKLKH